MTESKVEEPRKDSYRLKRDITATTRLNLQHYIWKENIGYLIHPSVDFSSPTLTIADVGTGTGHVCFSYGKTQANLVQAVAH